MFTGIVTDVGEVVAVEPRAEGLAGSRSPAATIRDTIAIGASIACAGVCLTVVARGKTAAAPGLRSMPPPRRCASPRSGSWRHGTRINLERSLKIGDELGGHIVAGHADGLADADRRARI